MERSIYLDGELVSKSEAKISVFDHGLLYGDGVFEGLRVYSGRCFRLDDHVRRLYDSATAIALEIPVSRDEMSAIVEKTVAANGIDDGYVRLIVTRGVGDLGLDPRKCPTPSVICIADGITLYPEEIYANGLELVTVAVPRNLPEALSPQVKSLNYLNNILAKIEAINAGTIEAIMLNHAGYVAECSGDNVFFARDGVLRTPHPTSGGLKGITRDTVMDLARGMEIPVEEPTQVTRYELYVADEVFLTGSAAEIVPVVKIDGRTIGTGRPGATTGRLLKAFHSLVRQG